MIAILCFDQLKEDKKVLEVENVQQKISMIVDTIKSHNGIRLIENLVN